MQYKYCKYEVLYKCGEQLKSRPYYLFSSPYTIAYPVTTLIKV